MPQSLARILVHLIYSTKNRERLITPELIPKLGALQAGIYKDLGCPAIEIGGTADHVHSLFLFSKTIELCDVIEEVKKGSSRWMKNQGPEFRDFYWQSGYGAFSVSQSHEEMVCQYIRNQEEHHREMSFQDEFRAFLRKYKIEYDERYVWD